jgi:hypothetical protein
METDIIAWKAKHLPPVDKRDNDATNQADHSKDDQQLLGHHYWRNFLHRHKLLVTKKAVRFDSQREDWCTYQNFQMMYENVYASMKNSGIAMELERPVWFNAQGSITQDESEAIGRKTKYLLSHPRYLLFVDEVGDNTSQRNDGNAGGQKFVVGSGQRALICSSYQDTHFTVLGFTNALGEAICCAIILCGQDVEAKNVMGFQPWAEQVGDPTINMEQNSHGLDKVFPFGPTCHFQGKEIPTYVTASENGSITDKILTDIMQHLDFHLTFDRSEATPFLLLDGHGSRFGLPFLEYIRDK